MGMKLEKKEKNEAKTEIRLLVARGVDIFEIFESNFEIFLIIFRNLSKKI